MFSRVTHVAQLRAGAARRAMSTATSKPIGIVMLNMGGPSSLEGDVDGVKPFLTRLFTDKEIIRLGPLQSKLGPYIANKRTPKIIEQYSQIGGKSPIGDWTRLQGQELERKLNDPASPFHVPGAIFKHYIAFRYAPPLTEDALTQMKADGVERAIAFSQYPQWSCTTAGSSLNHLWREVIRTGAEGAFKWSVIDRWHSHPIFLDAVARRVRLGLEAFAPEERDDVVLVFSAHSVPMMVVNEGDVYVNEIAATVNGVMGRLASSGINNRHSLAWQSKVGFLPWMGPPTAEVLKGLGRQGRKRVLVVPIAFTSDHVETLFEIDLEYAHVAKEAGITTFKRAPSLNDEPLLTDAMADLVKGHLASGRHTASPQYKLNCPGCTRPACRSILDAAPDAEGRGYVKDRDACGGGAVPAWPTAADREAIKAGKYA